MIKTFSNGNSFPVHASETLKEISNSSFVLTYTDFLGVNVGKLSLRALITTVLILSNYVAAWSQIDLKNSLYELKNQFLNSKSDTQRVNLSLAIGSFYLTNKVHTNSMKDSSLKYVLIANDLSSQIHFINGQNRIKIFQANQLLKDGNYQQVKTMVDQTSDELHCQLHLLLGKFNADQVNATKTELDRANINLTEAQRYASKNHLIYIDLISQLYEYKVMRERDLNPNLCDSYFLKVMALIKLYNNKTALEQALIIKAGLDFPNGGIKYLNKVGKAAKNAGDQPLLAYNLKEIADNNLQIGQLDSAESQLKTVLKIYGDLGYKNLQYTYDLLNAVAMAKGNSQAAMSYGLAAVKCADQTGTDINLADIYDRNANDCRTVGLPKQAEYWEQKNLNIPIEIIDPDNILNSRIKMLIKHDRAKEILKQLDLFNMKYPNGLLYRYYSLVLRGDCYDALGKTGLAEKYYMMALDNINKLKVRNGHYTYINKYIAKFYLRQQSFEKAAPYVDTLLKLKNGLIQVKDLADLHSYKFRIDSARGKYVDAIKHFEASKIFSDSLSNQARQKQSEQLQLQYSTAERDHENLVLRNHNTMQQGQLEKESLQRKITTLGLVSAVFVILVMIYLYYIKQQSNKILKNRQQKIDQQNVRLNQLLNEKEWLIKEIHHRVKNNLQIIASLLNTQSSVMENEQVKSAFKDSQNRIHVISAIHKKLYQSEDLATINLQVYMSELAHSIIESFQSDLKIKLELKVDNVQLSTTEIVPLGLILNEAITNSVKYAFKDGQRGIISISFYQRIDKWYELSIQDNGTGLPENFDIDECSSLGLNMITGLTKQLFGKCEIRSDSGTQILIQIPSNVNT